MESEVEEYLRRRYEDLIANVVRVSKEDLRMVRGPMTFLTKAKSFTGLSTNVSSTTISKCPGSLSRATSYSSYCRCKSKENGCYGCIHRSCQVFYQLYHVNRRSTLQFDDDIEESAASRPILDAIEHIIDAREWDVPYHIRVAIDKGIPHTCVTERETFESESGTPSKRKPDKLQWKSSRTD
jgi:DNA polymerase epsilon subunit 1